MTNIYEFGLNEKIIEILIENRIVHKDGGIYAEYIKLTSDSFESYKDSCESYENCITQVFENQTIQILTNFRYQEGYLEKTLFFIKINNEQNLVLI